MKLEIQAMAFPRKKAEAKISGLATPIIMHSLKLLFFGAIDKSWTHDLIEWLDDIASITLKDGKLKPINYYNWLYDEPVVGNKFPQFFHRKLALTDTSETDGKPPLPRKWTKAQIDANTAEIEFAWQHFYFDLSRALAEGQDVAPLLQRLATFEIR